MWWEDLMRGRSTGQFLMLLGTEWEKKCFYPGPNEFALVSEGRSTGFQNQVRLVLF